MELDDLKQIEGVDKSGMLGLLVEFPKQCAKAADLGELFSIKKDYIAGCSRVLFTGLGGSAIGADLIRSYLANEAKLPIFVNRNYTLPNFVGPDTLVIASSYSGNTEETISAYEDAKKRGARLIAITSGGTLADMARADAIPLLTIPGGLPPRAALGYSFFPSLVLLSKLGVTSDKGREIDGAIRLMDRLREKKIGPKVGAKDNPAKGLAQRMYGKFPVIYGGQDHIDSVVVRWRSQIAENSKTLASSHIFPEMNHNEIVGWQNPKKIFKDLIVLCLRDSLDHPRTKKRMDITRRIIAEEGVEYVEVESMGQTLLEKIFSLIYIGDFVSFYLAALNGVDPTPVERVTYLKKELAKG